MGFFRRMAVKSMTQDGDNELNRGNYSKAIIKYDKALFSDPNNIHALLGVVKASFHLANYPQTFEELQKCIEMNEAATKEYVKKFIRIDSVNNHAFQRMRETDPIQYKLVSLLISLGHDY